MQKATPKVIYEPHPVTRERKAELRAQGFQIIDVQFKPPLDVMLTALSASDEPAKPKPAAPAKPARTRAASQE